MGETAEPSDDAAVLVGLFDAHAENRAQLDRRRSVLWRNDYARPPIEADLLDELRRQARELAATQP